jgi:hypothetical protein
VQTFLPLPNYRATAQCLDYRRLGKQRIEAKMLLEILLEGIDKSKSPWRFHPVVKMWEGSEYSLCMYGMIMCEEWIDRRYKDTTLQFFQDTHAKLIDQPYQYLSEEIRSSHRSALLKKDYEHYKQMGWKEKPIIDYKWKFYK